MSLTLKEALSSGIHIPTLQTLALNCVCRNPSLLKTKKIRSLPYPIIEAIFSRLKHEYKIRLDILPGFRNLQKCSLVTSATHDMLLQHGWIEELSRWVSLRKLNLLNCKVDSATIKLLGTLTQLEVLKIGPSTKDSGEKIDGFVFREFLSKMTNIKSLTLFKIAGDIRIDWFTKLKRLKSLKLKTCRFHSDLNALTSLSNLTDLELSGIPFEFDSSEKGLLKIFKKSTGAYSWPAIERLTSLLSLNLSHTNVTLKWLEPLTVLTNLRKLDISATDVRPCPQFREIFSQMTFLEYLGCVGNQFYGSVSKIDKLKLVGEVSSLMEALQYCKRNITDPTLVKKKMTINLIRDSTPRNRKELELLFKIVEYHRLNEESNGILKDCLRLMAYWVDDCYHWIFGKVEYACAAIVSLMNMFYDKPVMADLCWLVTRLFLKVETSVGLKMDLCEFIRCGIVDVLHKARLANKKTNNLEVRLKITQAIAAMGSVGSQFFASHSWNGERPLRDLLAILRALKRDFTGLYVSGTQEQRSHYRDIVRWCFWGLYCQVLKDSKSNYWKVLIQSRHIDTIFFYLNDNHTYAFKNTTCLLMALASKPKFIQILYERNETFPFLKATFHDIVDKQVTRYSGAIVEKMAADKERAPIFLQHDDLLALMVEKCRMVDLDTGLEISHGIKELCKDNVDLQKRFLEMEKGLKYMVNILNQANSMGTRCYDTIVVIVDAIRGVVDNNEENQNYLAENLGTDWIAKLMPFMESTIPLVVNNVLVTLHGIIIPVILVAERRPEAAQYAIRMQQRFVNEHGHEYLLKLLNNPNQSKEILENCVLIAGNFIWNYDEGRKTALRTGLLEPLVRVTVNNDLVLFTSAIRHLLQSKDVTVKSLLKQEVLRDGSITLLSEYIRNEKNWNVPLDRLRHVCYIILQFSYLDSKICSKLRRHGVLEPLTRLLFHCINKIKNDSKSNSDKREVDNADKKMWRDILEHTSNAISMMCSDDLVPKNGKCCLCLCPIVTPGIIRYQCQTCDSFNLCATCYKEKFSQTRHPQDHVFVEDNNYTCTYVYIQSGHIKSLLECIRNEQMYDTSVLGNLLRIIVGMTYQSKDAAQYVAEETDFLQILVSIIKTRQELPKTLYSTLQNIFYYKESQNKILENPELVHSLIMLLKDKPLEQQDDILNVIKNLPEHIMVQLGVLDIFVKDWLLSPVLHLQRTALKALSSLIHLTNTKRTIFRELELKGVVPVLLLSLLKEDTEIRKFAANLIVPKRENVLAICEQVSILLKTLQLKTTTVSSPQSLPLLVEWTPKHFSQNVQTLDELKRVSTDMKQTEKRSEIVTEIHMDNEFHGNNDTAVTVLQNNSIRHGNENVDTRHISSEISSQHIIHNRSQNDGNNSASDNFTVLELSESLAQRRSASILSASSSLFSANSKDVGRHSLSTLVFFPTLKAISEPLISKLEAILNNVLGAIHFMLSSTLEHSKLVKNTPLIGQLFEILRLCPNNIVLVDTIASILFHLTADQESWIYEEIVNCGGHEIVANLLVSKLYWSNTHALLLGVGGGLCKKNKIALHYWCSRRDILDTIFDNFTAEAYDNKIINTIYLFYNMSYRNHEFIRQVFNDRKNELNEMFSETSTNAQKLAACRILAVLSDNYHPKSLFEKFIQPCVNILKGTQSELLKLSSLLTLKVLIRECPDNLKVVLEELSFVTILLDYLTTNTSPGVLKEVLGILIELAFTHPKIQETSQLCEASFRCATLLGDMVIKSNIEQKDNENLFIVSYVVLLLSSLCKKCNECVRTLSSFFCPLILCAELKTTFYGGLISLPSLICRGPKRKVIDWFKDIFSDERLVSKFGAFPSELDKINVIVAKILEGVREEADLVDNKLKYASTALLCWCEVPCVSRLESLRKTAPSLFASVLKGRNADAKFNIIGALHLLLFWDPTFMKEIEPFGLHHLIVDLFLDEGFSERTKQVAARCLAFMSDLNESVKKELSKHTRLQEEVIKAMESDNSDESLSALVLVPQLFPSAEVTAFLKQPKGLRRLFAIFQTRLLFWQCSATVALELIARQYFALLVEGDYLKECFVMLTTALETEDLLMRESSCRCLVALIEQMKKFSLLRSQEQTEDHDATCAPTLTNLPELKSILLALRPQIESIAGTELFYADSVAPQVLKLLETL